MSVTIESLREIFSNKDIYAAAKDLIRLVDANSGIQVTEFDISHYCHLDESTLTISIKDLDISAVFVVNLGNHEVSTNKYIIRSSTISDVLRNLIDVKAIELVKKIFDSTNCYAAFALVSQAKIITLNEMFAFNERECTSYKTLYGGLELISTSTNNFIIRRDNKSVHISCSGNTVCHVSVIVGDSIKKCNNLPIIKAIPDLI